VYLTVDGQIEEELGSSEASHDPAIITNGQDLFEHQDYKPREQRFGGRFFQVQFQRLHIFA
jgi:hypothetical protein